MKLNEKLNTFVSGLSIDTVAQDRKQVLQGLIDFVQEKTNNHEHINLNFICTHNSRRSHLSQIWAQTMAEYYAVSNVICYSGGTEATALFPMIAKTLSKVGFRIETLSTSENPVYSIKYAENAPSIIGFSKEMDHPFNPRSGFAAIMTCSQADEGCPFVPGAEKRIPVTYEDPKAFDFTPEQEAMYMKRSIQIASEMNYVFSKIQHQF